METENHAIEIVAKATGVVSEKSTTTTSDFSGFLVNQGGLQRVASTWSDPIVVFDDQANVNRFIFGVEDVNPYDAGHAAAFDLAVSKTATPASLTSADWYFYQLTSIKESGTWPDYPGNFGYNADAFVFTMNEIGTTSFSSQVTAIKITDLIVGNSLVAGQNLFTADQSTPYLRPTVMHDSVHGDPMWLIQQPGGGSINVFKMTNFLTSTPAFSTTTLTTNVAGNTLYPTQPDGSFVTNRTGTWIMKAAEFNNFIVACNHMALGPSPSEEDAFWYEIDVSQATPSLKDHGNVGGGNNTYTVYPGIDISQNNDIAMTYLQSGGDPNSSLVESGSTVTVATQYANGLAQGQAVLIAGVDNSGHTASGYDNVFTVGSIVNSTTFIFSAPSGLPHVGGNSGDVTGGVVGGAVISQATESGTTATIVTATPHGFTAGQSIVISGCSNSGYNGIFTVSSVVNSTTFIFTNTNSANLPTASGGGAFRNLYMSMYVTGRNVNDPAGTMQTPVLVQAGQSLNTTLREGDLSGISADTSFTVTPVDQSAPQNQSSLINLGSFSDAEGTFWAANEWTPAPSQPLGSFGTSVAQFSVVGANRGATGPWSVAVDWGDGSTSSFNVTTAGSLGTLSHTYRANGVFSGSVTVTNIANPNTNVQHFGKKTFHVVVGMQVSTNGFTPTPTGFTVTFTQTFVPADLTLYGPNLTTPQDVTLVGNTSGPIVGSLIIDPSNQSLTFKATSNYLYEFFDPTNFNGTLPDDTYTVKLLNAGFFFSNHTDYVTTFTTSYRASRTPVLGIPDFARGPDSSSTIKVPNDTANGIPITLYNDAGAHYVTFTLSYNPTLLTVTGGGTGDSTDPTHSSLALAGVVINDPTHATASFSYGNTALTHPSGTVVLGDILAYVPNSAASNYGARELLQLGNISIDQGPTTGNKSSNGIHVNGYFGDVTGSRTGDVTGDAYNQRVIDQLDVAAANAVAEGIATGFAAFPLVDPAILGDVALDYSVDAGDVSDIAAFINKLLSTNVIPTPPVGLVLTITSSY